ncbi:hypothetical protein B0F90DRAFT_1725773, partial [Multifurca ochricompacta]
GSVVSAIGVGINSIISAITVLLETIITAIVTVRRYHSRKISQHLIDDDDCLETPGNCDNFRCYL